MYKPLWGRGLLKSSSNTVALVHEKHIYTVSQCRSYCCALLALFLHVTWTKTLSKAQWKLSLTLNIPNLHSRSKRSRSSTSCLTNALQWENQALKCLKHYTHMSHNACAFTSLMLSPGQTIATSQRNISQHCWPSICKLRPNDRNIWTQQIPTLLGTTCYVRVATLL